MLIFGDIVFPVLAVLGFSTQDGTAYAAHDVIEGKRKLQFIGEAGSELTLNLKLHVEWGDPDATVERLQAARRSHEAQALATLAGRIIGIFVIGDISVRPLWTFEDGVTACALVDLKLSDPGVEGVEPRVRPAGVRDNAEDIVTTPKPENTSRPIGDVTPQEIARR